MISTKLCATRAETSHSNAVLDSAPPARQTFFLKRNNPLMWLFRIYL